MVAPHGVDHSGRDAALTRAQKAAAVHDHQQAAMPEEHLEGRTTDAATWLRTPESLDRLAAFTREAEARRRDVQDHADRAAPPTTRPDAAHRPGHEQHRHDGGPGPAPGARP
ncbi:hypothetical protein [Streptomyces sp. NPDC047525]|uniref:hypothetical protein n=1 Tax=Streptomyces sp. NPDC047525 TaxID=3155264 RepID=UPI0033DFAD6B